MEYGPLKSIFLKGNLQTLNGVLSITLPFQELRKGLWQITIAELGFEILRTNVPINNILTISTNFIIDLKYNEQKGCNETYNPILTMPLLKLSYICSFLL